MSVQNGRKSDKDKYVHFHLTSLWASFNFVTQILAAHPVHFPMQFSNCFTRVNTIITDNYSTCLWCDVPHLTRARPKLYELLATATCNPRALHPIQLQRQRSHSEKKSLGQSGPSLNITFHPLLIAPEAPPEIPCVPNVSALRHDSLSEPREKANKRKMGRKKWVPQGIQTQRQVCFPDWNVSSLKWFISTSLEHTLHMLPFALRQSCCSRAGNRQRSENTASTEQTPGLWNTGPILQLSSRHKVSKLVKKESKGTRKIWKTEKNSKTFSCAWRLSSHRSCKHKQNAINPDLKAGEGVCPLHPRHMLLPLMLTGA